MKQDEIRELMNDKFTEITQEEYRELGRLGEFTSWCSDGNIYFKPKEQWPKIIGEEYCRYRIDEEGVVTIIFDGRELLIERSLDILYAVVEISKQQRGKKQ